MTILLEHQAKKLLSRYGVPTTTARLATDAKIASSLARDCDGPVAMKIASPDIVHKERADGVRLNVNPVDAAKVYDEIIAAAATVDGARINGVIVEPMIEPGTEIIIGALCDPVFGPVVMFGAGGTKVEDQGDVTFRLAPLDERDAHQMIAEVGVSTMSASESGITDAVIDALVDILLSVGGLDGLVLAEGLVELDINPLIITGESVIAVDAHAATSADGPWDLAALGVVDAGERKKIQSELYEALRPLFYPERIVVVGASAKPGKLGFRIMQNLVDFGFVGKLYAVHPSAENIYGCPAFPTVADLPETVDRAIIAIGAEKVPDALSECAAKGVRVAQVLTAGFAEWSDDGKALDNAIKEIADRTGMRIVGPNTIGAYCGAGRITMSTPRHAPQTPGGITFISQSGTYAWDMIHRSQVQGLPLGKSLSCGNCSDVIPTDYLLFSAEDPDTDVIAMYLESDADAGRFFHLARDVEKPLILFKGGRSSAGVRAATSHTGAMASDQALWTSAARQAGAAVVDSMDDLLDLLLAVEAFGAIAGRRLVLFGSGGGVSVVSADVAEANDMEFPPFTDETKERLEKFGVPGTSVDNPIDIPVWGLKDEDGFIFHEMIELLAQDPNVDSIITYVEMNSVFEFSDNEDVGRAEMEAIVDSILLTDTKKIAVSAVLRSVGDKIQDDFVREARPRLLGHGIAVYPTTARAIRAHALMMELGLS
jgi:acyl-CoA synthetase (NDP forming)